MALAALADVEAWLGLASGNTDEALLTRLLTAASTFVETWCDRTLGVTAYSEVRDGNGLNRITPYVRPIVSVSGVTVDTTVVPAAPAFMQPGWWLAGKSILLFGYEFCRGNSNVLLSYSAGFATIPADISQAVIELVAMRYRERSRIGLTSVHADGETTSYSLKDMPAQVATILSQYRAVVPR